MTPEELEKREQRAQEEQMVIMQVEEGVRVYAPQAPHRAYIVAGSTDVPTCTCPDFEHHQEDPDWRCKHILAVQSWRDGKKAPKEQHQPVARTGQSENGSHMVVKRSVSPDGRIDSLSVEFSVPIGGISAQQIASQAERSIRLSSDIAEGFRHGSNGSQRSERQRPPQTSPREPESSTSAIIEGVGGMDTKWGRRLFLNIRSNGATRRYFGSAAQIERALASIGYPEEAKRLREGASFSLPCNVLTKSTEDGRYVNVVKILPAQDAHVRT